MVSRSEQPERQSNGTHAEDNGSLQAIHRAEVDWHLADLLQWMDAFGISFDLTLWIDGFMITGKPISTFEFWERLGENVAQGIEAEKGATNSEEESSPRRELAELLGELFRSRGSESRFFEYDSDEELERIRQRILNTRRDHITLSDVIIYGPDGEEMNVDLWRGRLDHVAGWTTGRTVRS
jgi:hypothetical protein